MSWYLVPTIDGTPTLADYDRGILFGTMNNTTKSGQWHFLSNSDNCYLTWLKFETGWRLVYGVKNNGTGTFYYSEVGTQQNASKTVNSIAYGTQLYGQPHIPDFAGFDTEEEALASLNGAYPITYRLTNCTSQSAPNMASVGSIVTVPFTFPDGYGIVNDANVYVTNNGVVIPSTYSNGVLTFTMPDPS